MIRPIDEILAEHRRGSTIREASEALHRVVAGVVEERRAGQLVLTIKVQPHGDGAVMVDVRQRAEVPEPIPAAVPFYVTPEGNLQRVDTRQHELELEELARKLKRQGARIHVVGGSDQP